MKYGLMMTVFCLGCFAAIGELSEEDLERLQRFVRIDSVRDETIRNENREKVEVLEFSTSQDERNKEGFCIRITVELKDGGGSMHCAQVMRQQVLDSSLEYAGQDRWELRIPHGDMDEPDIRAYVIEYGVMDGGTFIPFVTETGRVDTLEEIVERCQALDQETVSLWHAFVYREYTGDGQEELQSAKRELKK